MGSRAERYVRLISMAGSILLCAVAIVITGGLLLLSERKKAAVGRRYVQLNGHPEPSADDQSQRDAAFPDWIYNNLDMRDLYSRWIPHKLDSPTGKSDYEWEGI